MGLGLKVLHLAIELKKNDLFKDFENVIDMGDQDLHIDYETLKRELHFINHENFEKMFRRAKFFPERPRVSSSALWKSLGFKNCDRLDIEKIERDDNDVCDNFVKIDLNFPIEKQIKHDTYDLVTDLGNNEHPFNVVESYKTMHKLCNKNGMMLIHQNIFGGNGFYNFDISFFENLAAVNNYTILYSCYTFDYKNEYFNLPINENLKKCINLNIANEIGVFYIFKKNTDKDFIMPYQGSGASPDRKEVFISKLSKFNNMPSRTYVPKSINDFGGKDIVKALLRKLKILK